MDVRGTLGPARRAPGNCHEPAVRRAAEAAGNSFWRTNVMEAPNEQCEAIRIAAMARLDRETTPDVLDVDAHLSRCDGCRQVVAALRALHGQLETLPYPSAPVDIWPTLAGRI